MSWALVGFMSVLCKREGELIVWLVGKWNKRWGRKACVECRENAFRSGG